jgi:hypothetical protein
MLDRELYKIHQIPAALGNGQEPPFSVATAYRLAKSGDIKTTKIGSRMYVTRKDLLEFIYGNSFNTAE